MNDLIRKMALDAHLLNYIDLETPRYYFISGNAEEEDLHNFAELIVKECIAYCGENLSKTVGGALKIHFGIEELQEKVSELNRKLVKDTYRLRGS